MKFLAALLVLTLNLSAYAIEHCAKEDYFSKKVITLSVDSSHAIIFNNSCVNMANGDQRCHGFEATYSMEDVYQTRLGTTYDLVKEEGSGTDIIKVKLIKEYISSCPREVCRANIIYTKFTITDQNGEEVLMVCEN